MTRMLKTMFAPAALALMLTLPAGVAVAQSPAVTAAIAAGQVGERADGYLGIRGSVSAEVRGQVEQINIKRRALYTQKAAARGVSVEEIALATGCQTLKRTAPGHAYTLDGATWQVRDAGAPPPSPPICPN